jgi:hypothetical protein
MLRGWMDDLGLKPVDPCPNYYKQVFASAAVAARRAVHLRHFCRDTAVMRLCAEFMLVSGGRLARQRRWYVSPQLKLG